MPHFTSRGLPYPDIDDGPADVPLWLESLVNALNTWTEYGYGLRVARPVSTPANPGKQGRWYYSTDFPSTVDFDTGVGWVTIGGDAVLSHPAGGAAQTVNGNLRSTGAVSGFSFATTDDSGGFVKGPLAVAGSTAFSVLSVNYYSFELKDQGQMLWSVLGSGNDADVTLIHQSPRTLSIESTGIAPSGVGAAALAINGLVLPHPFLMMGA